MTERSQYFDLLALPKDVLGLIFNKLDVIDEMRSHRCVAKSWDEVYWSTLTDVIIDPKALIEIEDRQLIYALSRVNPLKVYSVELFKYAPKLTFKSLSLLSQFINLKSLRLIGVTSNLLSETLTNLVSLRDIYLRSIDIDEECMNAIADNLPNLTRIVCAASNDLFRWRNAFKLTKLKELILVATKNFTPEGYSDITKLSNLSFLNVSANGNIDNDSLPYILSMTNLQSLNFMHVKATLPRAYSGLAKMTNLQKLQGKILPDEETLSYLSQAYSLTSLEETRSQSDTSQISAKFLSTLTNLKNLTTTLKDTRFLKTLTDLEDLISYPLTINEEFPFQALTNLTQLSFENIHGKAMQKLSHLVKLQLLNFRGIVDPQENDFEGIQFCENLRTLNYFGPQVTPKQFGYIAQIPRLEKLTLTVPPTCADEFFKLTQLTSLVLRKTDWDLEHLKKLTALTTLKYLRIIDSTLITRKDISTIQNLFSPDIRTSLTVSVYRKSLIF